MSISQLGIKFLGNYWGTARKTCSKEIQDAHLWEGLSTSINFLQKERRILNRTEQLVATFPVSLLRRQPCQLPYYCRNTHFQWSALVSWVAFVYTLICCSPKWSSPENALGSELWCWLISVGIYYGRIPAWRGLSRLQVKLHWAARLCKKSWIFGQWASSRHAIQEAVGVNSIYAFINWLVPARELNSSILSSIFWERLRLKSVRCLSVSK